MASVLTHWAYMRFGDSRKREVTRRVRISEADFDAYNAAADDAARAASKVGLLFAAMFALSEGSFRGQGVTFDIEDDAAIFPATNPGVYNYDQVSFQIEAGGIDDYVLTIPARDMSVITTSDGVNVLVDSSGTAEVQDLVAQLEDTYVPKNGLTPVVIGGVINR